MTAAVTGAEEVAQAGSPPEGGMEQLTGWRRIARNLARQRVTLVALAFLALLAVFAILVPVLSPYSPIQSHVSERLQGPSAGHWLGTDELGRDVLTRILYGAQLALVSSIVTVTVAFVLGTAIGITAGYFGGLWGSFAMRVTDIMDAVPLLLVAMAIVAVLGSGLTNAMIAVSILFAASFARLARGMTLAVRAQPYVDAVRVLGIRRPRILLRHVFPNVAPPLIIRASLTLGTVILVEASLSFLGLGVELGTPSWGGMLNTSRQYQETQPLLTLAPGLAITLTVLAFNLLGDGLQDALSNKQVRRISRAPAARAEITAADAVSADAAAVPVVAVNGDHGGARPRPLLEVSGLSVEIAQPDGRVTPILSDIGFTLDAGQTLGLVGESGSGKSMTASAIMAMLPPSARIAAGSIRFDGAELVGRSERDMSRIRGSDIGMIMQDPMAALSPVHTVGQQLIDSVQAHAPMSRDTARERSVELLDMVGVADARRRLDDYPHQFSGGMAQRVVIAAALASSPRLLIADEPSTALDVLIQKQVLALLADLQERLGMALLLITHDLGVIAETCERVGVMYAGEIVEVGLVRDLFARPRHPYTAALLRSTPRNATRSDRSDRLESITGVVPPPWAWPTGCRFAPRCAYAEQACRDARQVLIDGVRCRRTDLRLAGVEEMAHADG